MEKYMVSKLVLCRFSYFDESKGFEIPIDNEVKKSIEEILNNEGKLNLTDLDKFPKLKLELEQEYFYVPEDNFLLKKILEYKNKTSLITDEEDIKGVLSKSTIHAIAIEGFCFSSKGGVQLKEEIVIFQHFYKPKMLITKSKWSSLIIGFLPGKTDKKKFFTSISGDTFINFTLKELTLIYRKGKGLFVLNRENFIKAFNHYGLVKLKVGEYLKNNGENKILIFKQ